MSTAASWGVSRRSRKAETMSRNDGMRLLGIMCGAFGYALFGLGLAAIYPPAALLFVGASLMTIQVVLFTVAEK